MGSYTIGLIVYAQSRDEAKKQARNKLKNGDHTTIISDIGFDSAELEQIYSVDSTVGKKRLEELVESYKNHQFRSLDKLRDGLKRYTNEDIWKGDDNKATGWDGTDRLIYEAHNVGGGFVHLFDDDCESIQDATHLNNALQQWPTLSDISIPVKKNWGRTWLALARGDR